ncbi:DMT family transporter [Fusobacterium sp.]|uniref:EamA/RhaT family transporter n=1 Tax=Fusobacterium nucleatum TaxID=851 RepID=A0A323TWM0_FUSNU|nr:MULTISPECIES: DMT family transporter [Fusobacterium]PCR84661.1 EamA family transporter [Fusobacterium nucleatum]PZA03530.1 EamA/RhaT family transporter [Fusobacterium nucleatum]QJX49499.1 EamA family transporter [Fusobacterium nucleatum]HCE32848.1 EamA family transporter [Fusobacterium sp.]
MKNNSKAYFLIIAAVIIWSLSGLLVKAVNVDPLWISLIRCLGGGIFLLPYIFKEKIYPIKNILFGGIFMAIFLLSLTITTRISSSAMAISMQYTAPMYVIGYGFYKSKEIKFEKFIVFLFIFAGIIFNSITSMNGGNWWAIVSGITIGLAFVFYSYNLQKVKKGNLLGIVALINIISAIFYGILLLFRYSPPPSSFNEIIILSISGIVISGISYALYGEGLREVSMEKAMIICLAEPVLNPLWVYLGKGEIPSMTTVTGSILILLSAIIDIAFSINNNKKTVTN